MLFILVCFMLPPYFLLSFGGQIFYQESIMFLRLKLLLGLAYYIAMKVPELAERVPMLKQVYDEQFDLAAGEDREKAAIRFVPRQQFIGSGYG